MKLANLVILAIILSTMTPSKRRKRVKTKYPFVDGPFAKITATIESVNLYDDNLIKIADALELKSKTEVQLTGERKIRETAISGIIFTL